EAKSVNSRGLDLRLRTPPGLDGLEAPARKMAAARFSRGSLQLFLILEPQDGARGLKIDPVALASAVQLAKEIAAETGLAPARVDGLLALKGVIVADDAAPADEAARALRDAAILESLAVALDGLARERQSEGAKLCKMLASQLDEIEALVKEAGALASAQPQALKEKLAAQMQELLAAALAQERLAQEAALLAARADIREELDRLAAHVADARAMLKSGQGVGRKLDFLAQEFNREANTLCSKSADIQLTRAGLALKAVIDQFREQSQNVE
ncbi:MAG: YicC family protein, partial [Alphaproteobacteria bacterium]|nr:YicC family protein [Alphaproteobacteria bacterium]